MLEPGGDREEGYLLLAPCRGGSEGGECEKTAPGTQPPGSKHANGARCKRLDIQGLRAIAIVGVLLFHLWPKVFSNGYLGVDGFFVLSGYLMSQMLSSKEITLPTTASFYRRRAQRIVPMYILSLYATLVVGSLAMTTEDYNGLVEDAKYALSFSTNLQNIYKQHDYFELVQTYKLLLHTWSLAVEMQFYLIVPLLFRGLTYAESRAKLRAEVVIAAVGVGSLILQLVSSETVAFGFVPCRIWQFAAGIFVHRCSISGESRQSAAGDVNSMRMRTNGEAGEEGEVVTTEEKVCVDEEPRGETGTSVGRNAADVMLTLLLCAIVLAPSWSLFERLVSATFLQVAVIVATAALLYSGGMRSDGSVSLIGRWILGSRPMVMVGDASYIGYLIHWPLFQYTAYLSGVDKFGPITGLALLSLSISAAWVLDKYIDTHLRAITSIKALLGLITALYGACLLFILPSADKLIDLVGLFPLGSGRPGPPTNSSGADELAALLRNTQ